MTDGINMERMAANTAGWPTAAAEHARLLALRINADFWDRKRLEKSLCLLQRRYQQKVTANNGSSDNETESVSE